MSDPAGVIDGPKGCFMTNCHPSPSQRNTTHSIKPVLPGPKSDTTIVWLPEPMKDPHSTLAAGSDTSGSFKWSRRTISVAAAFEQSAVAAVPLGEEEKLPLVAA